MSWFRSNWKPLAAGVFLAAATAAGVFYTGPGSSTQQRPLLSGFKHDSKNYLNRHAQGWLTCPAAATKCYRWKMQETSGDITDDLSGDSAVLADNGTPNYALHTPIPMSDGFTREAIRFLATGADYFVAGDNVIADQTTNDFSVAFWIRIEALPAADQYVVNKYAGAEGFAVLINSTGEVEATIDDSGAVANGPVTAALGLGAWHFVVVKFDRSGNATADVDGVASGVTLDISGNQNTITVASPFQIGRYSGATNYLDGLLSEVMVANGLMTTAESLAAYKAFKVPTGVTFAQTTTRKFPIGTDGTFGEKLGVYGGSATNPQWPTMYASTLVNASSNPLGLGFPGWPATTNVIGYANEFNSWTGAGAGGAPTVTANFYEAPDGSMTAEKVQFANGASTLTKAVAGGGNVAAGERWRGSLYYKYVSGTTCDIRLYNGTTAYATLGTATTWGRAVIDGITAAEAKQLQLSRNGGTDCIYAFSDAQYEEDNLTPPCTSTAGDVSQTCNASYYTATWASYTNYMPSLLTRGEIELTAAIWPSFDTPTAEGTLYEFGDGNGTAILERAATSEFYLKGSGGEMEGVSVAKPMQAGEAKRAYVASWDTDKSAGLSNTSPRRYAALSVNGQYQSTTRESRTYNASTQIPYPPVSKLDADGNFVQVIGYGTQAVIESAEVYARPAQTVRVADTSLVVNADFSGSSYMAAQAIPRFECPSGVDTANCWIWDMGEFSGSLYDRVNGVALAPSGTPRYQAWTGLLAAGNGRRSTHFTLADSEYLRASSSSIGDIGEGTVVTLDAWARTSATGTTQAITSSASISSNTAGYVLYFDSGGYVKCCVDDGAGKSCRTEDTATDTNWHFYTCVATDTGDWSVDLYRDGIASAGAATTAASGSIANANALTIASSAAGTAYPLDGELGEVRVVAATTSAGDALARYKDQIQDGTYLAAGLVNYRLNGSYNLGFDSSGNGNHLTVVNGTPDPRYRDMPWPAGSGLTKPAVEGSSTAYYSVTSSSLVPADTQSYSVISWMRTSNSSGVKYDSPLSMFAGGASNDRWILYRDQVTGNVHFYWEVNGSPTDAGSGVDVTETGWHLVAGKAVKTDSDWKAYVSADGAAFVAAGSTVTGDPSQNDHSLILGYLSGNYAQFSGAAIFKNYALTDADVASYYLAGTSPVSSLTYARTNKACYDVGNDPVTGMQVRCFQADEVPFAWHDSLDGIYNERLGFGLPVHDAAENLALQSEDVTTTWTNNNTSDAANSTVAPDGTYTADTVTATDAAGDLRQVFGAITAAAHTYCQYLKRNGAANVAGFIRLVTDSTNGVIASTAFTATSAWQRFCVSGTATLNDTRVETEITTNAESVYWWGASLSTFDNTNLMIYCPTTTAAVTCNATSSNYIASASLGSWTRAQGVINWTGVSNAAAGYGFDLHNGTNLNGAVRLLAPTTEAYIYDSSATLKQRLSLANAQTNTLTSATVVWDNTTEFYTDQGGTARHAYGSTYQSTYHGAWPTYTTDANASWTAAGSTDLHIGMEEDGTDRINGIVRNVSVYGTR